MRILLADDHTLVRAGIRALVESFAGCEVVGEAASAQEVLVMAREQIPDVVLMDITMKDSSGLEAAGTLKQELPQIRVIILSMHATEDFVSQALQAGAAGYLLKDAATNELEIALQAVTRGETYLSPRISRPVVERYLRAGTANQPLDALTPRQREILKLIAEGQSTKEIAYVLGVSVKTVETHRAQLMERLEIRDIAGLVRFAIKVGLVAAD
jgi:DNA-binding NarL/FixJ family response regulator